MENQTAIPVIYLFKDVYVWWAVTFVVTSMKDMKVILAVTLVCHAMTVFNFPQKPPNCCIDTKQYDKLGEKLNFHYTFWNSEWIFYCCWSHQVKYHPDLCRESSLCSRLLRLITELRKKWISLISKPYLSICIFCAIRGYFWPFCAAHLLRLLLQNN